MSGGAGGRRPTMSLQCPSCGSKDIEPDEARGEAVCVRCGTVCEENSIVSSIEFSEAGGASSVIGQFVSANCTKPYSSATRGRSRYGIVRNSRETTLANGRRRISQARAARSRARSRARRGAASAKYARVAAILFSRART